MKTNFFFLILTLVTVNSFGQITFEKGYFIDNQNQRVECLIKNMDWKYNPDQFDYKLTAISNVEKGSINTVKEFGVTGSSQYVRADVKMDVSPADANNLSQTREPEWSQEQLFLKVLVGGKASLYFYENTAFGRFFYSVSDTAINQLIYKEYRTEYNQVAMNCKFREQLWNNVRYANSSMSSLENIRFNRSELERYFKKYNSDGGNTALTYGSQKKRDSFQLRLTPGLNYSWVIVTNAAAPDEFVDFGHKISYRIGVEAQFILPFNRNKWGILFDPGYQYINASGHNTYEPVEIRYQSIEFPIGLRHTFFMNKNLIFFIDALFIANFCFDFNSAISNLGIRTGGSFAMGGGAAFKKISAEIRYSTDRNLLNDYVYWNTDYRRISLILGYKLF